MVPRSLALDGRWKPSPVTGDSLRMCEAGVLSEAGIRCAWWQASTCGVKGGISSFQQGPDQVQGLWSYINLPT